MINPSNNDVRQPQPQGTAPAQTQPLPTLPPILPFPLLNQDSIPSIATVMQRIQEGNKRLRDSENDDSKEESHLSKKIKIETSPEGKKGDDLGANFDPSRQILDANTFSFVLNLQMSDKVRALLANNRICIHPFQAGIENSDWSFVIVLIMAIPSIVNSFNNLLVDSGKIAEFIDYIKANSISNKTKILLLNCIFKDRDFWCVELTENKKSYFLKLFEVKEAFQNDYLSSSIENFLLGRSYSEISWIVKNMETSADLREGLRFNSHHLLLKVVSYSESFVTTQKSLTLTILKYYPEVDLFDSTEALLEMKTCEDSSAEEDEVSLLSYEESIYCLLAEHARSQNNYEFFNEYGMKAFKVFPFMYKTSMVIQTLSGFSFRDLQEQIRLNTVPLNLLNYMQSLSCQHFAREREINLDKLLDRMYFINFPCEEPEASLEFYNQLYHYELKRLEGKENKRSSSILTAIAKKEVQIKMEKVFESVIYTFDAHEENNWFYLPKELKEKIALMVFKSERPLSSIPKKMLLEKRANRIRAIKNLRME